MPQYVDIVNGIASVKKYYAANTVDAMDMYAACISAAGWEIWDSGLANNGYVFKSKGSDNSEMPIYVHMYQGTNVVNILCYAGWNNVTHTGTMAFGNVSYTHVDADDDSNYYIYCVATKDSFVLASYPAAIWRKLEVGRYVPLYEPARGILTSSVTAGSSKTLTLSGGQVGNFQVGTTYKIFNESNREQFTVESIDVDNDQIVADSLTYAYDAKDVVSHNPQRWFCFATINNYCYHWQWDNNGTANDTQNCSTFDPVNSYNYYDPDPSNNLYGMSIHGITDCSNTGLAGFSANTHLFRRMDIIATSEHTVSVFDLDTGTVDTATSASLTDTSKSWTSNEYANKALIITGGTGAPLFRKIVSNTSDTITVSGSWTLDATSTYTICEEGWMFFYFENSLAYAGAIRMI